MIMDEFTLHSVILHNASWDNIALGTIGGTAADKTWSKTRKHKQ